MMFFTNNYENVFFTYSNSFIGSPSLTSVQFTGGGSHMVAASLKF